MDGNVNMINQKKRQLQTIIKKIVNNSHPRKIILFGSATNPNNDNPNDFDLLIIKHMNVPRLHRRAEILKEIDYNIPLDILVFTPEEVEFLINHKSPFLNDLMEKGVVLYESEESLV